GLMAAHPDDLLSRQDVLVIAQARKDRVRGGGARAENRATRRALRNMNLADFRYRVARQDLVDTRAELVDDTDNEVDRLSREPANLVPRLADEIFSLTEGEIGRASRRA